MPQAAAQAKAERAEKARKLEEKRMQAEQKFRERAAKVAAEADAEAIERQSALAGRRVSTLDPPFIPPLVTIL